MNEAAFWTRFVLAALATWRVTHLLANEDGPADLIARFRVRLGQGIAGKLMDCFHCLSLWIAAPAALFVSRRPLEWMFAWLALSGAACLLQRTAQEPVVFQPLAQPTQGEPDDVMLRSETRSPEERQRAGNESRYSASEWRLPIANGSTGEDRGGRRSTVLLENSLPGEVPAAGPRTSDGQVL